MNWISFFWFFFSFISRLNSLPVAALCIYPLTSAFSAWVVFTWASSVKEPDSCYPLFECVSQECSAAKCLQLHPVAALLRADKWLDVARSALSSARRLKGCIWLYSAELPPKASRNDFHQGPPVHLRAHITIQSANHPTTRQRRKYHVDPGGNISQQPAKEENITLRKHHLVRFIFPVCADLLPEASKWCNDGQPLCRGEICLFDLSDADDNHPRWVGGLHPRIHKANLEADRWHQLTTTQAALLHVHEPNRSAEKWLSDTATISRIWDFYEKTVGYFPARDNNSLMDAKDTTIYLLCPWSYIFSSNINFSLQFSFQAGMKPLSLFRIKTWIF